MLLTCTEYLSMDQAFYWVIYINYLTSSSQLCIIRMPVYWYQNSIKVRGIPGCWLFLFFLKTLLLGGHSLMPSLPNEFSLLSNSHCCLITSQLRLDLIVSFHLKFSELNTLMVFSSSLNSQEKKSDRLS